jgi:predicted deacetylase
MFNIVVKFIIPGETIVREREFSKAEKWAANARLNRIHRIARVRNFKIISLSMVHASKR